MSVYINMINQLRRIEKHKKFDLCYVMKCKRKVEHYIIGGKEGKEHHLCEQHFKEFYYENICMLKAYPMKIEVRGMFP